MKISLYLLILIMTTPGAADPPSPAEEETTFAIDDIRREAEALVLEQSLLSWKNRAYGEEINLSQTYEGHGKLFAAPSIKAVAGARSACRDARERKALDYLERYLLSEHIAKEAAPLDDEIRNTEAGATVLVDGEKVPYRQINPLLAAEESYDRRRRLSDAQVPVLKKLEPAYRKKEKTSGELAHSLGYGSYNRLSERLRGFSLDELAAWCEKILAETDKPYAELLPAVTREFMGIPLEKFRRCDILRLFRMEKFESWFPASAMLPAVSSTLKGMGIDLAEQKNIRIHDEPLPKKNPRAACYPLKVPGDVRLTLKPTGGVSDYETLLHEMGHAQHFAHTRPGRFEFSHLGDNTVTEAWAFLFEELLDDPEWIDAHLRLPPAEREEYLRFRRFAKMYIVRRYAAKLLYEKQLHAGAEDPREVYRRTLGRAYGFPLDGNDAERYLSDVDDFYYVADYLRAWFLKAQIEKTLIDRFGERWFEKPEAGEFLSSLWAYGQELNGDELAKKLGYDGITPDILISQLLESTPPPKKQDERR